MKEKENLKILLLSPPTNLKRTPIPPIGLCYLKAYLLKHGFLNTKVLDMTVNTYDYAKKILLEIKPDIVGIGAVTEMRHRALKLAEIAKSVDKEVKIVLGGPHATPMCHQIIENYAYVDFICLREAEVTFLELAEAISNNGDFSKVKGIVYRDKGQVITTPPREFISDLDSLPFPNYDGLDMSLYRNYNKTINSGKEIQGGINSSRSCPYSCFFCTAKDFWGNKWRVRSPKNVVDEVQYLYEKYNIKSFNFTDDNFMVDTNRVVNICREIVKRDLKIKWFSHTRVDNISAEALKAMKKAGCELLGFGVDSGSEKVLKAMNKRITIDQVISAFAMTKEAGLATQLNIIVGHPGEDNNTFKETKKLLSIIKPDLLLASLIKVYPGTPLYELAKKQNICDDDFWLTQKPCPYYTKDFSLS
ncbi:MAG: radical SAM protein, partial [Candidatus Omnitrophota bacterium]